MGDARRFDLFAECIATHLSDHRHAAVADVAGGQGYLQLALRERGFGRVTTFDKRWEGRRASRSLDYRYRWFAEATAPQGFGLVVGMHPDAGSDHLIRYACRHRVPFAICPCCIKPSAVAFTGHHKFSLWVDHLARLAEDGGMTVYSADLKMAGRNLVLLGWPTATAAAA